MYLEQSFPENRPPTTYVKLQKLEIPKYKSYPKNFHKWKGMFERYTKECGDEAKYDYLLAATEGEAQRYVENRSNFGEAMVKLE